MAARAPDSVRLFRQRPEERRSDRRAPIGRNIATDRAQIAVRAFWATKGERARFTPLSEPPAMSDVFATCRSNSSSSFVQPPAERRPVEFSTLRRQQRQLVPATKSKVVLKRRAENSTC